MKSLFENDSQGRLIIPIEAFYGEFSYDEGLNKEAYEYGKKVFEDLSPRFRDEEVFLMIMNGYIRGRLGFPVKM